MKGLENLKECKKSLPPQSWCPNNYTHPSASSISWFFKKILTCPPLQNVNPSNHLPPLPPNLAFVLELTWVITCLQDRSHNGTLLAHIRMLSEYLCDTSVWNKTACVQSFWNSNYTIWFLNSTAQVWVRGARMYSPPPTTHGQFTLCKRSNRGASSASFYISPLTWQPPAPPLTSLAALLSYLMTPILVYFHPTKFPCPKPYPDMNWLPYLNYRNKWWIKLNTFCFL